MALTLEVLMRRYLVFPMAAVLSAMLVGCAAKSDSAAPPHSNEAQSTPVQVANGQETTVAKPTAAATARAAGGEPQQGDFAHAPTPKAKPADAPSSRGRTIDGPGAGAPKGIQPSAPGPVKAGEWDDNANYREFQRYLTMQSDHPIHRADVSNRQFLVVRDADGHAVPRCNVTVRDEDGAAVTLATTASGRALLFPRAEGLRAHTATATANCEDGRAMARIALDKQDGVVDLKLDTRRSLPQKKTVDLAFILDTTGSMGEEITAVKATIQKVATALAQRDVTLRIGLVEYKDRTDAFVTRVYDMTTDVAHFRNDVSRLSAGGGGDYPESVNEGLHVGLTRLEWSGDAVLKLAFLIGDAPPHLDYQDDADYAEEMKGAAHRGIQVFTVAASGMDALGQIVWRQIAQYTGATNLFVLRGGAGPQSVGGGDPASSCGGTQTAYASGNLDELIVKKVERELKAIDGDPLRIPGAGMDENAKPCNERIVFAQ
jgi:Mg-chelatase subunit ChlD